VPRPATTNAEAISNIDQYLHNEPGLSYNVRRLYAQYKAADVELARELRKEAWGGTVFVVRDPDGNAICFAG
jgi:uncharacterized glyoxalase superfamily protein PhnB